MGWKIFSILAYKPELGPITTSSEHDSEMAGHIAHKFGLQHVQFIESSDYDQGLYPRNNELYVGAYPQGYIISSSKLVDDCCSNASKLAEICALFPGYEILVLGLHSVVNYWTFIYCHEGKLIRGQEGDADHGVIQNYGGPLPEEVAMQEGLEMKDGKHIVDFDDDGKALFMEDGYWAEEVVFELAARVFGQRLDQVDFWDLKIDKFNTSFSPADF